MELLHIGRMNLMICRTLSVWICLLLLSGSGSFAIGQEQPIAPADKPAAAETKEPVVSAKRRSTSELLPTSTRFWVSVEDLRRLETNIANTQIGTLSRQDTLAPFFASFEKQLRDSLNNNGIKFGLDVASVERLQTGEVSVAGVLPDFAEGEKPVPRSHGIVVLIDVSPHLEAAREFLSDAAEKMEARGATLEKVEVLGTEVSKWTIEVKAAKIGRKQSSFVTIVDGWLLASDNESIFSNVLRRVNSKERAADSLSGYEPFTTVDAKTRVESLRPDLRWYLDPLGYARFADALAEEKTDVRQPKDRPLEALSKEGLDALKAVGGFVSFSTEEHDVVHRTLVYANRKKAVAAVHKRLFDLLDFSPKGSSVAEPPAWIPVDAAGYFSMTWDINKAFKNVGPMVDAFFGGKKGNLDAVMDSMKKVPDFKVDIRKMVQSLGNRITIVAKTEEPIDASSEKMIVGIELKDGIDTEWLIKSIGRAVKGKVKKLGGYTSVIDDRTAEPEEEGLEGIDGLDFDDLDEDEDDEEDADAGEKAPPRVTIFNRRIMVIRDGTLFICNDKDYLKKFLARKPSSNFGSSADFEPVSYTHLTLPTKA